MLGSQEVQQFLGGLERPQIAQEECLLKRIVDPNRNCEYGRNHGFGRIRSVEDYRQAVPICQYEDLQENVERMKSGEMGVLVSEPVRRFFLTSGSTSVPKFIPVTNAFIGDKLRAFGIYWTLLRESHPKALRGKMVTHVSAQSDQSVCWVSKSRQWRGDNASGGNVWTTSLLVNLSSPHCPENRQ